MKQKKHNQTTQPFYEPDEQVNQWDYITDLDEDRDRIDHERGVSPDFDQQKVVVDVETTAETPQRPIIATAFDEVTDEITILLNYKELGMKITEQEKEKEIKSEIKTEWGNEISGVNIQYKRTTFLKQILTNIVEYNQNQKEIESNKRKTLVAHNMFFDLGMLTESYENEQEKMTNDDDGVMSIPNWDIHFHRAGAKARLYRFKHNNIPKYISTIDTMTVADCLMLPQSLEKLGGYFGVDVTEADEHGEFSMEYLHYNIDDVMQTYKICEELERYFTDAFNSTMNLSKLYSSASIGKRKLKEAGYNRTHYSDRACDLSATAYFGGRTEALQTGQLIENMDYTDLMSQYPSASAMCNLWKFMTAEKVESVEVNPDDIPSPSLEELKQKETWEELANYYVVLDASSELLPVRVEDDYTSTTRVHMAETTCSEIVYHYFDYLGAKLYADAEGRDVDIDIKSAFKLYPIGQQNLNDINIGGQKIESGDNVMKRGIEERKYRQYKINNGEKDEKTKSLKIVANSLYGVSAERLVIERQSGDYRERHDVAGSFYNPHFATGITAAGRLMITAGELTAEENGGKMVYCDTDSFVINSHVSDEVIEFFADLNPYDGVAGDQEMLEVEDHDGELLTDISIFTKGVKKYAIIKDGDIVMSKEHGLGHYQQMREGDNSVKFWADMLMMHGIRVDHDIMTPDEKSQILTWQDSVSSRYKRLIINNLIDGESRYGDFMERTITSNDGIVKQYIATSFDDGQIIMIDEDQNIELVDEISKEGLKTVGDLLNEWETDILMHEDGRNEYKIIGTKKVTKEATDLKTAIDDELEQTLEKIDLTELID